MKLYAVRHIYDKQAVGIFYAAGQEDLAEMVDEATETTFCEFVEIEGSGGLIWTGQCAGFGVFRDFDTEASPGNTDEPALSVGDKELRDMMAEAMPTGSFDMLFFEEMDDDEWKVLIPGEDLARDPDEWSRRREQIMEEIIAATNKLPGVFGPPEPKASEPKKAPLVINTNIYFIGCDDHVKIGMAMDVEKRLKSLTTGHHRELTLLAVIRDVPGIVEFELHQRFAAHRVRGEWFKLVPEIQAYIDEVKGK